MRCLCNGEYVSTLQEIDKVHSEINSLSEKIDTNYSDLSEKMQSDYDALWGQILEVRNELDFWTGGGNS